MFKFFTKKKWFQLWAMVRFIYNFIIIVGQVKIDVQINEWFGAIL